VAKNWKADGSTIATNVLKVSSDTDGSTGTASADQGCQISIGTAYQNRKNVPNHHKIYQMAITYSKVPQNTWTFSIPNPFKMYPNWYFGMRICHLAILKCRYELWNQYGMNNCS
jgi:hypothetical protein